MLELNLQLILKSIKTNLTKKKAETVEKQPLKLYLNKNPQKAQQISVESASQNKEEKNKFNIDQALKTIEEISSPNYSSDDINISQKKKPIRVNEEISKNIIPFLPHQD
jgi:hypothetical protein